MAWWLWTILVLGCLAGNKVFWLIAAIVILANVAKFAISIAIKAAVATAVITFILLAMLR